MANLYVVKPEKVGQSLKTLRELKINELFIGYLALRWAKHRKTSSQRALAVLAADDRLNLRDIRQFHELYLRISGGGKGFPYAKIFRAKTSARQFYFNNNIAGTYAPSSLRETFREVVDASITGGQATYILKPEHWVSAHNALCHKNKIPVVELAAFLFRDYALEFAKEEVSGLVEVFKDEFGYEEMTEFDTIFSDDSKNQNFSDWFADHPTAP